jgi:probable rRNA maturation factor
MASLLLYLSYGAPRAGVPAKANLHRWMQGALDATKAKGFAREVGLSVRFCNEIEARQLNFQYRQKDYPTNVLSFPAETMARPKRSKICWLGDLVICPAVVSKEALSQAKPLRHHYAHLSVHGLLHLLGFDHKDKTDAAKMEALEVQVLAKFGIANPY